MAKGTSTRKARQSHGNPKAFESFRKVRNTKTTTRIEREDGSSVHIEQTRRTETLVETTTPSPRKRKLSAVAGEDLEEDQDESGSYDVPVSKRKRSNHILMDYESIVRTRSAKKAEGETHVQLGGQVVGDNASADVPAEQEQIQQATQNTTEQNIAKKTSRNYDTPEHREANRARVAETVRILLPRQASLVARLPVTKALVQTAQNKLLSRWFRSIPTTGDPSNDKYGKGQFSAPEHFDNLEYKLKLKITPYPEKVEPTPEQVREVIHRLQPWHKDNFGINLDDQGRDLEAGEEAKIGASVDSLVRVLMAQATNNDMALVLQDILRQRFTYIVNGAEVVGDMPNYHAMRVCTQQELEKVIGGAGFGANRAFYILYMLDYVYQINEITIRSRNNGDLPKSMELGQQPNTSKFVPGMLSLDQLNTASEATAWSFLLNIWGMGVKSSACVQSFHLAAPVIAVDTHIRKMCVMLGWAPKENIAELELFKHISGRIPNESKHLLHQLFWYHPQQCQRCRFRATGPVSESTDPKEICPLESVLDRSRGARDNNRKAPKKDKEPAKRTMLKKVSTWCFEKMVTKEKASELGLVLLHAPVDGDFGTGRITGHLAYYMKPRFWEAVTVEQVKAANVKVEAEVEAQVEAEG